MKNFSLNFFLLLKRATDVGLSQKWSGISLRKRGDFIFTVNIRHILRGSDITLSQTIILTGWVSPAKCHYNKILGRLVEAPAPAGKAGAGEGVLCAPDTRGSLHGQIFQIAIPETQTSGPELWRAGWGMTAAQGEGTSKLGSPLLEATFLYLSCPPALLLIFVLFEIILHEGGAARMGQRIWVPMHPSASFPCR